MIRQATNSDIDNLSLLIHEAWQKDLFDLVGPSALDSLSINNLASQLKKELSNETQRVIVYEKENEIVGYASGNTKVKNFDSEIVGLYVSHKAQQGGVGSYLFNKMKSLFKSQNKSNMIVWTLLGAPNNQFYLKNNPVTTKHRDIIISGVKYSGIGYVYSL